MTNLPLILKIATLLGILIAGAYYLYTGVKAFRMELGDFEPTSYNDSEGARIALARMLDATKQVEWDVPGSGTQRAYYVAPKTGHILIQLHGTPGNGAGFHEMATVLASLGIGSLAIDLPGYGASEGERSWRTHYERSVIEGINFLAEQPEVDPSRISILGYSQGGAVVSRVAALDERIYRLIYVASYTNLYDQLNHQFRWRLPGIGLFAVAAAKSAGVDFSLMDSVQALSQVSHKPVLVISGDNDQAIPVSMAEALADTSTNGQLWIIAGGNHINLPDIAGRAYYERIAGFVQGE